MFWIGLIFLLILISGHNGDLDKLARLREQEAKKAREKSDKDKTWGQAQFLMPRD